MALHTLPGLKPFFDATMLTSVGQNPGDLTQPKRPFVYTQAVPSQTHPLSPPPPPPLPPPRARTPTVHPQSPTSDSASGFAAGDVAERQLGGPGQSPSGSLGGKVIGDPAGGKNHVVWVVSDSHLDKQQGPGSSERKKKLTGGFSPFKRMLTRGDKRRSATEISISAPLEAPPSPAPSSSQPSSQSLDGQHLLHLVRTNDDLTQQLIAKSNAVVNLEANVSELTCAINQMKLDVEEAKLRETKYGEEIRMLLDAVASHETDASARNAIYKEQEEELAKLTEQLVRLAADSEALKTENEAMKTENDTLKMDLETSLKHCADVIDQNESQEQLIQDLQATIEELQEQINFLATERDSFKKYFATAKVDAAQKSEEMREKIVDLLEKQREITASIRKGLPMGKIAMKKALQKTEQFLEVKAQKQMLQQKIDFLSNKSFVQDMYIVDLRQVICELARVLFDHDVTPGYALRRALVRLNMPFDEIARTQATPYRWESADDSTSYDSSAPETDRVRDSDDSGSEDSGARWRNRKKNQRTRIREELSSEVSGSEDDGGGLATARYTRRTSNRRT